jgi:hypothetical protein
VDFADAFSEHLELLTNGTEVPNRRDKYIQQEMIRQAGLRAVRQVNNNYQYFFRLIDSFIRPYEIMLIELLYFTKK